ncbi:sugar-binding protein [Paenibacillus chartarius]|uniref:Sugar-binding protein n=1 Tax=Paenibacillus chartarius TaxID=747481 RepID=A0ABV6DMZ2_9BACL
MSNRIWSAAVVILFGGFTILLLLFFFTTQRIQGYVKPLITPSKEQTNGKQIVLIAQELNNPYWKSIEQGARDAASRFGMELHYTGPYRINPQEQMRLLEKAIAAKADGVLVQGLGDEGYRSLIDKAVQAGIPVIAVDTDEPDSSRLSYVGTDNMEAGMKMGELVVKTSGGAGTIGVLIGSERAPNQQLRLQGLRRALAQFPNLTVAHVRSSNISRLQAAGQAEELLQLKPRITEMVGFSALDGPGIKEAAERLRPNGLHIYAFDTTEETLSGLSECKITAAVVQRPVEMGYRAVTLLNEHYLGNPVPQQLFTPVSVMNGCSAAKGAGQ